MRHSASESVLIPAELDALDHATIVLAPILLEELGRLHVGRRVGIGIGQKRLRGDSTRDVVGGLFALINKAWESESDVMEMKTKYTVKI